MIQETKQGLDWTGMAAFLAGAVAAIISLGNAIQNWRDKKEAVKARAVLQSSVDAVGIGVTTVGTTVDGHATEQQRKIDALTQAVATQHAGGTIPTQTPGAPGNAPVGEMDGNVTVERRDAKQRSTDQATAGLHPEMDPTVAASLEAGLKTIADEDKK